MIWFLRFFAAFREMESRVSDLDAAREELQRLQVENEKLQDRLDATLEDRKQLWATVQQSNRDLAIAYQSSINVQWQQRGFGAPYPEAPQIPPSAAPHPVQDPIVPRREFPSERVARATTKFMQEIADRITPTQ